MLSLLAPLAFALLTPSPAAAQLATVYSSCVKVRLLLSPGATLTSRIVPQANTVALTFDDGPYIYETQIATTLKNAGIKGTFFVNGNNWECIYDDAMVKSIQNAYADGHEFGSHTWHHYDLTTLPWDGTGGIALQRIIGVSPAMMRPP
ncbi:carbohydrate esterase family 4 protein, partial [Ramaria rubella]